MKRLIGHVNFLTGKFTPLSNEEQKKVDSALQTAMEWIRSTSCPKPLSRG
jgi:hypothetical protein